jgi:SAM-dependent methyltransferase
MTVFDAYSNYYDVLYQGKDYVAEAQFVADICERWGKRGTILDLGCGTARHAANLVSRGFTVTGVERSSQMLERARSTRSALLPELQSRLTLLEADALKFRAEAPFDTVTALFHVISYQTTNADLKAFVSTAASHLHSGGIFVFDFWYGPAVLRMMPEVRVKSAGSTVCDVIRIATPVLRPNDNVVEVHYRILIKSLESGEWAEIAEKHEMRYMFLPELSIISEQCGFQIVHSCEFVTGQPLSDGTWGACIVARRI